MPLRPLVFVSGLTFGDYLLWNWSLNGNLDALALVAGLTLPPLALACLWLLVLNVARLLALTARRPGALRGRRRRGRARGRSSAPASQAAQDAAAAAPAASPPRKIAA